jgi:hypothetical protein
MARRVSRLAFGGRVVLVKPKPATLAVFLPRHPLRPAPTPPASRCNAPSTMITKGLTPFSRVKSFTIMKLPMSSP